MGVLPRVSGRAVVKALRKIGYEQDRQRASHCFEAANRSRTVASLCRSCEVARNYEGDHRPLASRLTSFIVLGNSRTNVAESEHEIARRLEGKKPVDETNFRRR